jgi:hypothetical protein
MIALLRYVGITLLVGFLALGVPTVWSADSDGHGSMMVDAQQGGLPAVTLTTLFGRALSRPTCPVERPGEDCAPKPLSAVDIVLQSEDGSQDLVTLHANQDGFFGVGLVGLSPGRYRLHPLAPRPGLPPYPPEDLVVEITAGKLTYVEIVYDSGVR